MHETFYLIDDTSPFYILGTLMEHFHEGSAHIKSFVLKVNLVFATFLG